MFLRLPEGNCGLSLFSLRVSEGDRVNKKACEQVYHHATCWATQLCIELPGCMCLSNSRRKSFFKFSWMIFNAFASQRIWNFISRFRTQQLHSLLAQKRFPVVFSPSLLVFPAFMCFSDPVLESG